MRGRVFRSRWVVVLLIILLALFCWQLTPIDVRMCGAHVTGDLTRLRTPREGGDPSEDTRGNHSDSDASPRDVPVSFGSYGEALRRLADRDGTVVLALVDSGFLDMGLNFHATSIRRHRIRNFLFVSCSRAACEALQAAGAPCFLYAACPEPDTESLYLSASFIQKTNLRTYMILEALTLGFTVLHTDVDVLYVRDPRPDVRRRCLTAQRGYCDMAPLMDGVVTYNAGFIYIRPTEPSKRVYQHMRETAEGSDTDDQKALYHAIAEVERSFYIQVEELPPESYQNGWRYYEEGHRKYTDAPPCSACVVIHNNWIVSKVAKIYRFRELLHWEYDGPERYYTSRDRKYLQYDNPLFFGEGETPVRELASLRAALAVGRALNRSVILPRFHCNGSEESTVLDLLLLRDFHAVFRGRYREHAFLRNPLVPAAVTRSTSSLYVIDAGAAPLCEGINGNEAVIRRKPRDVTTGATSGEIRHWFGDVTSSVLRFACLYDSFSTFDEPVENMEFEASIQKAFTPGRYRQY